jgi:hypothetical protein
MLEDLVSDRASLFLRRLAGEKATRLKGMLDPNCAAGFPRSARTDAKLAEADAKKKSA